MEKTCPTHHLELKFIPEGISKAGKRYNAFYGCPDRACKYSENIEEKKGHFLSMKAEMRRAKEIAYFNSVNAAVEMVKTYMALGIAAQMHGKTSFVEKNEREMIKEWRDWFRKEWEQFYIREVVEEADD